MSATITSLKDHTTFNTSYAILHGIITLAEGYGWSQQDPGVLIDAAGNESDEQHVSDRDAQALAQALRRALSDIPQSPWSVFLESAILEIKELSKFCEKGEFVYS